MLSLYNLSCARNGRPLFQNLSVTLGDCCALAVVAPNGYGKSTLLKTISGLIPPHEGKVLYANASIHGKHFYEYCDMIYYLGHELALKSELTVRENLTLWEKLKETPLKMDAALRYWGLDAYADTPIGRLSAGWKKKVALARLLISNAEIWLLDEPFANLDETSRAKLVGMMDARLQQGGTVIFTHHDTDIPLKHFEVLNLQDWRVGA
jgi:heme exporter protein A